MTDQLSKQSDIEPIELTFTYSEQEYLAASRLLIIKSEALVRIVLFFILLAFGLILMFSLVTPSLPIWVTVSMAGLCGIALFHSMMVQVPRNYFRGDPRFRETFHFSFSADGINLKTTSINSTYSWNLYTRVIENKDFYLLIYGKN